uniref:Uncharacterized protein n=1 Tax=Onchocerca volvulus TaxID=6282 RepID=A0A8R1Y3I1_ONCVO
MLRQNGDGAYHKNNSKFLFKLFIFKKCIIIERDEIIIGSIFNLLPKFLSAIINIKISCNKEFVLNIAKILLAILNITFTEMLLEQNLKL